MPVSERIAALKDSLSRDNMAKCALSDLANLVGKKWTFVVLQEIELNGGRGFNHILRRMGSISPKLLSQRLRELEKKGIIEKKVLAEKMPVRTVYRITRRGRDLREIVTSMQKWNIKYGFSKPGCSGRECVSCSLYPGQT
jgi:DNA-binding HxlR family transcriptional regulator